jgi:hypothetical protein
MKRIILAALVSLVVSGPAMSEQDGNYLYSKCSDPENTHVGYCLGYIEGVVDIYRGSKFYLERNVTLGQAQDIVKRWLANNPQYRHYGAPSLIAGALSQAFPCK